MTYTVSPAAKAFFSRLNQQTRQMYILLNVVIHLQHQIRKLINLLNSSLHPLQCLNNGRWKKICLYLWDPLVTALLPRSIKPETKIPFSEWLAIGSNTVSELCLPAQGYEPSWVTRHVATFPHPTIKQPALC